jgi:HTH-type transcriptional regulator/antitoxin HigA
MSTAQIEDAIAVWPQVEPALHIPRNDKEYNELVELMDRLIDEVRENESHPLASLMEVLGVLIERYEEEHVPELPRTVQRVGKAVEKKQLVVRPVAIFRRKAQGAKSRMSDHKRKRTLHD